MSVSGFFFMLLFVGYWYLTWKIFKRYMFDLSDLQGALFWFVAALGNAIVLAAACHHITDVWLWRLELPSLTECPKRSDKVRLLDDTTYISQSQ